MKTKTTTHMKTFQVTLEYTVTVRAHDNQSAHEEACKKAELMKDFPTDYQITELEE